MRLYFRATVPLGHRIGGARGWGQAIAKSRPSPGCAPVTNPMYYHYRLSDVSIAVTPRSQQYPPPISRRMRSQHGTLAVICAIIVTGLRGEPGVFTFYILLVELLFLTLLFSEVLGEGDGDGDGLALSGYTYGRAY